MTEDVRDEKKGRGSINPGPSPSILDYTYVS
jgi:hypothetical protein